MGAVPGVLECAVEVAAAHEFELRRQTESEVRFVREFRGEDRRGDSTLRRREIVVVTITDTVNTPAAEIRASGESDRAGDLTRQPRQISTFGRDLADEIRTRCGT